MDTFTINNFALNSNPEAQSSGEGSSVVKLEDRVICTIGWKPKGGSTFARLKYRLTEPYQLGDAFVLEQKFEMPENFYDVQNGMMRLLGLWNYPENGRLAFWIDSDGCPRLQTEDKNKKLASTWLWRGTPGQYPTGLHTLSMRIILGKLTEIFVDDNLLASVEGDNMPYAGYKANQILWMEDGANSNTNTITMICYEIGAKSFVVPIPDPCRKAELDFLAAEIDFQNITTSLIEAFSAYLAEHSKFADAFTKRNAALDALEKCKGLK